MSSVEGQARRLLVTGAAGFIGSHVSRALLDGGHFVIGVDNLNDYYAPDLKHARLASLGSRPRFAFHPCDVADHAALSALPGVSEVDCVIHLAAQAGVRYSIENPFAYASANLTGHLSILELVRRAPRKPKLVYASSSSVYGANTTLPFTETDRVDHPVSLYAATKRADEMMSEAYTNLYGLSQIGLRFFTVYGPWGRPDMAYWSFTEKILAGLPIPVFNSGKLTRDFTYIDDVVEGVLSIALKPMPEVGAQGSSGGHRIYNIGNNQSERLMRFIEILEQAIGRKAVIDYQPMQSGDVHETFANIDAISHDYGFAPRTSLEQGIPRFIEWYRGYAASKA